jgi:hypothetical protein
MSRSYKKTPVIKDNGKSKKISKTFAVRKTRRKLKNLDYEIADGKAYRKEFESWEIADYVSRWTKEKAIQEYETNQYIDKKRFPTLQSWINYWEKYMYRK